MFRFSVQHILHLGQNISWPSEDFIVSCNKPRTSLSQHQSFANNDNYNNDNSNKQQLKGNKQSIAKKSSHVQTLLDLQNSVLLTPWRQLILATGISVFQFKGWFRSTSCAIFYANRITIGQENWFESTTKLAASPRFQDRRSIHRSLPQFLRNNSHIIPPNVSKLSSKVRLTNPMLKLNPVNTMEIMVVHPGF